MFVVHSYFVELPWFREVVCTDVLPVMYRKRILSIATPVLAEVYVLLPMLKGQQREMAF